MQNNSEAQNKRKVTLKVHVVNSVRGQPPCCPVNDELENHLFIRDNVMNIISH